MGRWSKKEIEVAYKITSCSGLNGASHPIKYVSALSLGFTMPSSLERGPGDEGPFCVIQADHRPSDRGQRRRSEEKTQTRRQCDHRAETGVAQPQVRECGQPTEAARGKQQPPREPCWQPCSYDNFWPRAEDQ